jgi:hypothetical protein
LIYQLHKITSLLTSSQNRIQWPQHFNLSPDSNVIRIPIGLTTRCNRKAKVGLDQSVTYYAHAVDLAFAITVLKCQGGTFKYIIALLEHTPGSPALSFENLYVMFTRVKKASNFRCYHSLQHSTNKNFYISDQKFLLLNGEWILINMDTRNHMYQIHHYCQ